MARTLALLALIGCGNPARHLPPPAPAADAGLPPAEARALYLYAQLLMERQEWARAEQALLRAADLDPGAPAIREALAAAQRAAALQEGEP